MKSDLNYSPSDVFETFPQPEPTGRMERVGAELDTYRRSLMGELDLGLTKLYHRVHDQGVADPAIQRLRDIHVEVDEAVAEAYGWGDLRLDHRFHDTRQGARFTIAPAVQVEVLDRLLALNHELHAEEVRTGAIVRKGHKRAAGRRKSGASPTLAPTGTTTTGSSGELDEAFQDGLFPVPDALF